MIARFINRNEIHNTVMYDLNFYYVIEGREFLADYSLGGVIFDKPFDSDDIKNRAITVANNFFPDESLTEIIFE